MNEAEGVAMYREAHKEHLKSVEKNAQLMRMQPKPKGGAYKPDFARLPWLGKTSLSLSLAICCPAS